MFGSAATAAVNGAAVSIESAGIPSGFDELTRDRELLVDVFFGGRKVGEARVVATPGFIRFSDPEHVLALVPNTADAPDLITAFAADFPTNTAKVCPDGVNKSCGTLAPQVAGLIFDEDHFRVDLFINPKWLRLIRPEKELYLPTPTAPLSLTSSNGLALSGTTGSSPDYNFQNRTIIAFRNARIRSDVSYASDFGLVADTMVGEIERRDMRFSAGLFWAPGLDLTGQRRIVGVGAATQFDTRADRDRLQGTPLVVFLSQPSRVDILVDGRLVTSAAYEAGNNVIDSSALPDGSYSLLLRIHETNGGVHEERRFFVKNPQIAPVGQRVYFAYAGILANTNPRHLISASKDLFYQFGTAQRLSDKIALDVSVIGTQKKPFLEAGGWLITSLGRFRAAALASPRGDHGALLQVDSAELGPLRINFDLRRIWSRDNEPLIPVSTFVDSFESVPFDRTLVGGGSFAQAGGSIGYQLGNAYIAVIGSLRKDRTLPADYSVGPSLSWPIVSRNGLLIALQADAQVTRTTKAGFAGVKMMFTRGRYSVSNNFGGRSQSNKGDSGLSRSRAVGDMTAHLSYADDSGTDLSLSGGLAREIDSTTAHADGLLYTRFGSARGQVLHSAEGDGRTQYGLTLQTGAILDRDDAVFGGRDVGESAMVISVEGSDASQFDILINGQPRGRVSTGGRIPIFLEPYRSYSVKLRPVNAASVWYDSAAREFTLYPGNVQHVRWKVEHLVTIFGRAVKADGTPVSDAIITSRRGVGQSNTDGYFQVETTANDMLSFTNGAGVECKVGIHDLKDQRDYARVGKVVCQ